MSNKLDVVPRMTSFDAVYANCITISSIAGSASVSCKTEEEIKSFAREQNIEKNIEMIHEGVYLLCCILLVAK